MARRVLWASLVLAPLAIAARYAFHVGDVALFILSAAALVPLAWLVGESTEHVGEHTGAGIGGFANASFGNAPELIISVVAIADGLPNVVRGSLAGSIVSNLLLVLGLAIVAGGNDPERLDLRSLAVQLALVGVAVCLFLVPAVPGLRGDPERHSLAVVTIPVAVCLLGLYAVVTTRNLRRHAAGHQRDAAAGSWRLRTALGVLAVATIVTAFVSEILVHSLTAFAEATGLHELFISFVIVAIVGNAAEHGGAIVIAHRHKLRLATEIAISSSAQVTLVVVPAVALLSFAVHPALPLAFRPVELAAMGIAALFAFLVVRDRRSMRWEGFLLIGVYIALVAWVALTPDR